jgi:hypothetical protein
MEAATTLAYDYQPQPQSDDRRCANCGAPAAGRYCTSCMHSAKRRGVRGWVVDGAYALMLLGAGAALGAVVMIAVGSAPQKPAVEFGTGWPAFAAYEMYYHQQAGLIYDALLERIAQADVRGGAKHATDLENVSITALERLRGNPPDECYADAHARGVTTFEAQRALAQIASRYLQSGFQPGIGTEFDAAVAAVNAADQREVEAIAATDCS